MWEKIKQWLKKYGGYFLAFLSGLLMILLLGKNKVPTASDEIDQKQEEREKNAGLILDDVGQKLSDNDNKIKEYYQNKQKRGE